MEILIMQNIESLRIKMGYEEWEDVEEALLYQQGYDAYVMEVEDGEEFTIPEDYHGRILGRDVQTYYTLIEVFENIFEKEEVYTLNSGEYLIEGELIKVLGD